jgi:hypothetical protein
MDRSQLKVRECGHFGHKVISNDNNIILIVLYCVLFSERGFLAFKQTNNIDLSSTKTLLCGSIAWLHC